MTAALSPISVRIEAANSRTAFGDAAAACAALLAGRRALTMRPVLGADGGDAVPLALAGGRLFDETSPPNWAPVLDELVVGIPSDEWGSPHRPVFMTSSNFGVGSFHAFRRTQAREHLGFGPPFACVDFLRKRFGWGENVTIVSHACVSAHLGLVLAGRALASGQTDRALVFSFDFISPFVTGGFHALKILNSGFPAPYSSTQTMGSIGLADGAAFAVLTRDTGDFILEGHSLYNEMSYFTANRPDGAGFAACLAPLVAEGEESRLWIKGHGTGTLEAGRLEAETFARLFPDSPVVSWKGSLGHTLGSCGLVELAIAIAALRRGRTPGTIGGIAPFFSSQVAAEPFDNGSYDAVLLASNAFGGAHAACLLRHV